MDIKPINRVRRVQQSQINQAKIDSNTPRTPMPTPSGGKGPWDVKGGQIFFKGQEVGELIQNSLHEPAVFWSTLANGLEAFRDDYLRRNVKRRKKKVDGKVVDEDLDPTGELGKLSALVDAYIGKIMRIIKRKYDEKTDGISYILDEDGQLILNGMNVTSFVKMAQNYPNDKAKIFLKGLKNRLSIILSNKSGNSNYEKIRDKTLQLIQEIDLELKRITEKQRLLGDSE